MQTIINVNIDFNKVCYAYPKSENNMFTPVFKYNESDGMPAIEVEGKTYQVWRHGCRLVFKVEYKNKPYIVKLDSIGYDTRQCQRELDLYYKVPSLNRRFFPKIFQHGTIPARGEDSCTYLIQEYVDLDPEATLTPRNKVFLNYMVNKYGFRDIHGKFYSKSATQDRDYEFGNYGIDRKGNLKILDFAI